MADRIQILPESLINQIAAGEVVERPASVVKELIENSLDAGASVVHCRVEEGGRRLVKVVDNGEGMSREDVVLAVARHATSKISTAEDLRRIRTLGFRGEALPSIAAVSRMQIMTRRRKDEAGTRLVLEGGGKPVVSDVGTPVGTEVEVKELFFNTPARRKFLRSQATELAHIQAWLIRLGLIRSEVRFRLDTGKRTLLDAPEAADPAQRAASLLGREVFEHLHPVAYEKDRLVVSGLISDPRYARSNARSMFLFVNRRFVHDRLLQHAVMGGYRAVLPQGKFPVVILHLEVDPTMVDVNVHPQKTEVRFLDGNRIHQAFTVAVAEVLARSPWLKNTRTYVLYTGSASPIETARGERVREALERYRSLGGPRDRHSYSTPGEQRPLLSGEGRPASAGPELQLPLCEWEILGTLWDTYLFLASPTKLVVLDQHAAHERITFERLRQSLESGRMPTQQLLIPVQMELDGSAMASLDAHREQVAQLGFELEPFGPNTVNVTSVPAWLANAPVTPLLRDVVDELSELGEGAAWESARLEVIGRMACHASVRAGQSLAEAQQRALLEDLGRTNFAGTCPHGRPVLMEFERSTVERWFLRG